LIDRGYQVRAVVDAVRGMVEAGSAVMVLGNHEYIAVTYGTLASSAQPPSWLRPHTERNRMILWQTLKAYEQEPEQWHSAIEWFRSIPLAFETEEFRAVHACWDQARVAQLRQINPELSLRDAGFLERSVRKGSHENLIVERLLKGTDIPLPDGITMMGGDGVIRSRFRAKFWKSLPETYGDVVFQPDQIPSALLGRPLSREERGRLVHYSQSEKPLFVGHYWRRGTPRLIRNNIACLDYSAVRSGSLVAYRFNAGDRQLHQEQLVWVSNRQSEVER
jgi:hypothetical protein